MDASILRALIAKALRFEDEFKIQSFLEQARDAMTNMSNSPQEPTYQTTFASAFQKLKEGVVKFKEQLSPGDWERLKEIHSDGDFSQDFVRDLEKLISENAATPAVIRDNLIEIASKRAAELVHYRAILNELSYFGFAPDQNDIDDAQVGFKIPRGIFNNHFSELIGELNFIKRFVRLISETESEDPNDIEVGSISTTDPVFWIVVAYGVAKSIGGVTGWCLDTWKKVEDIRHIRAQTAKISAFNADEIEEIFGKKIQLQIDSAIKEKVSELTALMPDGARKNEIQNGLGSTLRQLLARIERGMTVDIRYLPPPKASDSEPEEVAEVRQAKSSEIRAVAADLIFPHPVGEPVLQIEAANDDAPTRKPTKT